jgi:hypothetical protein
MGPLAFKVPLATHAVIEGSPCRGSIEYSALLTSNIRFHDLAFGKVPLEGFWIDRRVDLSGGVKLDKMWGARRAPN